MSVAAVDKPVPVILLGDNVGSLDVAGADKGAVDGTAVVVVLDKLKSDDSSGCPVILPVDENAEVGGGGGDVVAFGGTVDVGCADAVGAVVDDIDDNDKRSLGLVVADD